jgi:hypothetical protein
MAFVDYVPGMRRGATARNIVLGLVYVLLLPVITTLSFVWAPVYVGVDYNDITTELSAIPGISPGGGLRNATVTFVYLVVIALGPRIVRWMLA